MTSERHSRANETSRHVRTRHVTHISRLMTKLTKNYSSHANNLLNVTIQSHSCCNQNKTRWIVATINPILRRPCVHHGTFPKVLIHNFCSSKHRESIIFAHNYFKKHKQTKHLIILIFNQVYFPFH